MKAAFLLFASAVALPSTAGAVVIKPTGASASSSFGAGYAAANTINGSGLPSPADIAASHATYAFGNHWTTAAGTNPLTQWIEWTFTTPQTIGAAYIWNHRSNGIAANSGYEVTLFDMTFYDAGSNVLALLSDRALAPDNALAQRIDFALLNNVSRVRFDIQAVQGSPNYTGLAEVAFDTESFLTDPIPEPATWAMMIAGFGIAGAVARRRRLQVQPVC